MTTTLPNGTRVPDVASTSWAGDLEVNWQLLDAAIGAIGSNVKTNRPNTWTAEQTFSEPIVGNLTGTASKAGADEDGTSIKTGYGKLAGNQTWTGTNTYTGASAIRFNNTSYVSGTPSGNIFYSTVQWGGYVNNTWSAPFTINNAIRTNGYSDTSFRTYSQTSNTLTGFVHETNADASDIAFRPIANGTHKLGSSSYQWSSVYAQTYYYNGTAWGLDKSNTWSGENAFSNAVSLASSSVTYNQAPSSNVELPSIRIFGGGRYCGAFDYVWRSTGENVIRLSLGSYKSDGTFGYWACNFGIPRDFSDGGKFGTPAFYPNNNNAYSLGSSSYQWSSVYAQSYYYNGTAWGLDKANVWSSLNAFQKGIYLAGDRQAYVCPMWDGAQSGLALLTQLNKAVFIGAYTDDASGRKVLDTTKGNIRIYAGESNNETTAGIEPVNAVNSQLGTSTNKWKTLNGVNPGALSLPDYNSTAKVDISGSIIPDQYGNIPYTPPINGWLYVCFNISNATTSDSIFYIQAKDNNVANSSFVQTSWMPTSGSGTSSLAIFFPVVANKRFIMQINFSNYTIIKAHVIPSLGNV